jgi:rare lipoprotein A
MTYNTSSAAQKMLHRFLLLLSGSVAMLMLSSCATSNGRPDLVWQEDGRQYGIASWYDDHMQRTANGELYNMYSMTAAHPSLALNSIVEVTHRENRRSVKVRVNDRLPPIHKGRVIDLSKEAFSRLDYLGRGLIEVEIAVIKHGNNKYVKIDRAAPNGSLYLASSPPPKSKTSTAQVAKRPTVSASSNQKVALKKSSSAAPRKSYSNSKSTPATRKVAAPGTVLK